MVQQIQQRRAVHHQAELYSIERFETCLAIRLTDRVDSVNFGEVLDELAELLKSERTARVVLDMRTVDMLQSVALGHVVQFQKVIRENGGRFRLCNVQPMIANVLEVTKLSTLVEVAECEKSAIRDWVSDGNERKSQHVGAPHMRQRKARQRKQQPAPLEATADPTVAHRNERQTDSAATTRAPTNPKPQTAANSDAVPSDASPGLLQTIYDLGWIGLHTKIGLAVVAVIVIFAGYRLFGTGPGATSSYQLGVATLQEISELRHAQADATRWSSFEEQTRPRITPHITKLSRLGADRSEFQSEVLAALKSLAAVIAEERNTPGDADAAAERHLAKAKALLE